MTSIIQKIQKHTNEFFYRRKIQPQNKNKDFTIISSNCWGTSVYEDLNIPYNTPTIGLFFMAPCYIKFIYNLEYYTSTALSFTDQSKYLTAKTDYPIGLIDDIEVHFMHYKDENEAKQKWERRVKRIDYSNIFYSFTDRDSCTVEHIEQFDKLSHKNKVFFSSKNYPNISSLIWLKDYQNESTVGDLYSNREICRKYFNIIEWLNKS